MTSLTNPIRLQIAEKGTGSLKFLGLLRWALVIIFLWFGGMKFTAYEAGAIAPFPQMAGAASALLGFTQMTVAALVGIAVGHLHDGTERPMTGAIGIVTVLIGVSYLLLVRPGNRARQ